MSFSKASVALRLFSSDRGQVMIMVPGVLALLLASSAFVIDMGNLYLSYQELLSVTQAAAKAAGQAMPNADNVNSTPFAYEYSGDSAEASYTPNGVVYNVHPNLDITSVNVAYACVTGTNASNLNMPPCASYSTLASQTGCSASVGCNAVQVTENATVKTFFARVFGVTSLNIAATASASAAGGGAIPYHIVLVLDTTASMGMGTDTGCKSDGSGSYTPEQCAQLGVQTFLSELAPCATNYSSCSGEPAVDDVALMAFPGICSDTNSGVTTSNCPNATSLTDTTANSTYAPDDYSCPASDPPIAQYNNNPEYLVVPFASNYRSSDTAAIDFSSPLVETVGAGTDNCGMPTPGGVETFYGGAIVAAQQYLTANHTKSIQDVMILLSDGDANSTHMGGTVNQTVSSSDIANMNGNLFSATQQCQQAVQAANWAKGVKQSDDTSTRIYSVSYGSETSGCDTDTSPTTTPCATMEGIASQPLSKYFFSVPQTISGTTSTVCSGAVPITHLSQVFTTIAGDLMSSRLIPNSIF